MLARIATAIKRQWLWRLLLSRSVVHKYWKPYRINTAYSLALIVLAIPPALVMFPLLLVRALFVGKLLLYELRIQGEFALLVDHFERIRKSRPMSVSRFVVVIRSTFRHKGLAHLYRSQVGCTVLWSTGLSAWTSQMLLLQPRFVLERKILFSKNYFELDIADEPLTPSRRLIRLREKTLSELGLNQKKYVTMAVFTSTAEEQKEQDYDRKHKPRETVGVNLAEPIDYLRSRDVDVILLGFLDTGKSEIPRKVPRLEEFAAVGGHLEVALASGCEYFWTDGNGAQWLRAPFARKVLITNTDENWVHRKYNFSNGFLDKFKTLPWRYQTPSGHLLTWREALEMSPCQPLISTGELIAIRNSPQDIIAAHEEMLAWIHGEPLDNRRQELYLRLESVYVDFPDRYVAPIALSFLSRYPYLLD